MVKEICEMLKLFYDTTNFFQDRIIPQQILFSSKCVRLRKQFYDWFLGSNEVIRTMASSMIAKFDKYWSGYSIVMV